MKKTSLVVLFVLGLFVLAIAIWPSNTKGFVITDVSDGNTLILKNGVEVRMIGVTSTIEGRDFLAKTKGKKVYLKADHTASFDPEMVTKGDVIYAYVIIESSRSHLNAALLREGFADIQEGTFLSDSLVAFRKYAQLGASKREVDPTPTPNPIIDYEKDSIVLPDPPSPDTRLTRKHSTWYVDGNMNLEMLEEACDYNCPYTKQFANSLAAKSPGNFNPGQICEIFEYCYSHWKYVNDPLDNEYLASASETIAGSLTGDCDDFAILMASCILSVGGRSCINTGRSSNGGHAFTEVDISQFGEAAMLQAVREHFHQYDVTSLAVRRDGNHLWMNLDWQAAYPGGRYWDCYERDSYPYENGGWKWHRLF